jgi:hypothetical protein
MEQSQLDRNKVWIIVTWPFETNQDFKKYALMVKYGPPKDKDLAGCNGFTQMCPRCHEPDGMQEHILKCQHVGAHKK